MGKNKFNLSKRRLAYCISATDRYSLCCLRFTHSVDLHQLLPILRLLTCKFIKAQGSTDILTVWPSKRWPHLEAKNGHKWNRGKSLTDSRRMKSQGTLHARKNAWLMKRRTTTNVRLWNIHEIHAIHLLGFLFFNSLPQALLYRVHIIYSFGAVYKTFRLTKNIVYRSLTQRLLRNEWDSGGSYLQCTSCKRT